MTKLVPLFADREFHRGNHGGRTLIVVVHSSLLLLCTPIFASTPLIDLQLSPDI